MFGHIRTATLVPHINGWGSVCQGQVKGSIRQKVESKKDNIAVPACFGKYPRTTICDCNCFYQRKCSKL